MMRETHLIIILLVVCTAIQCAEHRLNEERDSKAIKFFPFRRSSKITNHLNPNYQVLKRLKNPKYMIPKPMSQRLLLPYKPFDFGLRGFGKLFKFFKKSPLATVAPTTISATTTSPSTTTAITNRAITIVYATTCTAAVTSCPLGTKPKSIETEEQLQEIGIVGGNIYAGAAEGTANTPVGGLSFRWPSGNVISTTDADSRWDPTLTEAARANTDRDCLFWSNEDDPKLRPRQSTLDGQMIVACEA